MTGVQTCALPISVFLPGEIPWTEEPGGLQSIGLHVGKLIPLTFCLIHSVTPPSCFKRLDHGGRLNLSDSFLWEFGVRVPKHIEHTPALGEGQANCGIKMIIADLTIATKT